MLDVFFHSNRELKPPPHGSGYRVRQGWWDSDHNLSEARQKWDCCIRAPVNLPLAYKYEFLQQHLDDSESAKDQKWVGLLSDTDVFFQCSSTELKRRFQRFGTQLLVGAERRWFPLPAHASDPFGPNASLSWSVKFAARHRQNLYPNSGLLMGTSRGFEQLVKALRRSGKFPCCSFPGERGGFQVDPCHSCRPKRFFPEPVQCLVDDQSCLQTALVEARLHMDLEHKVDTESQLFLNLYDLGPHDLTIRGGRLAFKHTGMVPCVVHGNGDKGTMFVVASRVQNAITWSVHRQDKRSAPTRGPWSDSVLLKRVGWV
mmetsp:Transcript_75093/g.125175  ORF Transcript_75093/g.125175 Transcript_75093/m.125175 type:complete len:315 (+) Transcript_75093:37-981(+)|eukprot:CAMPEP_0119335080 /NCGR_PEP_ID=MMETSP1333-20130426/88631_1 /TAXON_ID=418940 /ORGANISM="Scyphosphaera apsteinii, Strain RCC1455" /LENGTH=314 /DNA_ID=CAMNT_0007345535 /DNA_START=33 /DNA_END=977 /DNA_ORIENTATION=-